jgi:hypothetical protein
MTGFVNRFVDVLFYIDMFLIFNLAYQEKLEFGGHWVFNKRTIAKTYLKGWFMIDFLSVLPFWIFSLPGVMLSEVTFSNSTGGTTSNTATSTSLMRMIRLLRMIKIARVLKASRILQRQLLDFAMGKLEMT